MQLTGIALQNLRQHVSLVLQLPKQVTVITGENASGKTTIAEALWLLATGDSFRASHISELITFDKELARVKGVTQQEGEKTEVEVLLTRGDVQGKKTQFRLFSVNGVRKRKKDAIAKFRAVLFRPEDMRLVEGSPSRRRGYLDTALSGLFYKYAIALKTYEQALVRRNKLLQQVRERQQPASVLQYWNMSLLAHGQVLQEYRQKFVASFSGVAFPVAFTMEYRPSLISEERMAQYREKELAAGHTLIGPHKDDFGVLLEQKGRTLDVAVFGSRGQQRLAVLWLKWCELAYIEVTSGAKPLLILDDSMSELDATSQAMVLELLKKHQSVVTSTDSHVYEIIVQALGEDCVAQHETKTSNN